MSSTTPLLFLIPPTRKDYLDNLRCILTISLIVHHALIETFVSNNSNSTPIAVFIAMQKAFLNSTFFFVSGHSTALSQVSRPSTFVNFVKKGVKVTLPALCYAIFGQWVVFTLLTSRWPDIFGSKHPTQAYAKFSGPIPYVILLVFFDSMALILRKFTLPSRLYANMSPRFAISLGLVTLVGYTFLNAAFILPSISVPHAIAFLIYDTPNPSFPLSHLIAYGAGWQFRSLKRSILSSSSNSAVFGLCTSICISSISLYYAQSYWPAIARLLHAQTTGDSNPVFVDGGVTPHTIFFAFWSAFTFFSIPVSLVSLFFHADWTAASWGWFGKNTYIQTYVHIIPVLVINYHLRAVENSFIKYGLTALAGMVGTWMLASIIYVPLGFMRKTMRFLRW